MFAFTLLTWEIYRDRGSVRKRIKSAETALACSNLVFPLHPSLQSWTARSRVTSRTASGRYCPAGRTVSASRPLCRIAATPATTFWALAPSPVRGTVPGIAPCPSACVSTSRTSCKWWYIYILHICIVVFFCDPIEQWCSATAPACLPTPRSQVTVGRWDRSSATAASASAPSSATQPECASWTASGAAHRHIVPVRKTQLDCVWAKRDDPEIPLLLASSF